MKKRTKRASTEGKMAVMRKRTLPNEPRAMPARLILFPLRATDDKYVSLLDVHVICLTVTIIRAPFSADIPVTPPNSRMMASGVYENTHGIVV